MVKGRHARWAGNVTCTGDRRGAYRVFFGRSEGKNHLEDLNVDGRIILKYTFKKWEGGMDWIGLSVYGEVAGCCESGNERLGSIKYAEFLAYLRASLLEGL